MHREPESPSGRAALGHATAPSTLPTCRRAQSSIGAGRRRKRHPAHVAGARLWFGFRVLAGDQLFGETGRAGPVPDQPAVILLRGFSRPAIVTGKPNDPVRQLDFRVKGRQAASCAVRRPVRPLAVDQHRHHTPNRLRQMQCMTNKLVQPPTVGRIRDDSCDATPSLRQKKLRRCWTASSSRRQDARRRAAIASAR
jgi:hypothetical protein